MVLPCLQAAQHHSAVWRVCAPAPARAHRLRDWAPHPAVRGPAAGWPQPNLLLQHLLSACSRWVEGGPFQIRVWTCSKLSAPFLGCLRAPARFLVLLCALVIIPVCICTQQEHASCTVQVAPVGGMLVLWGAVPCYQRGRPTQGQNVPSIRMYRHPALQCL